MKIFSWITLFILGMGKKDYVSQFVRLSNRGSSNNNSTNNSTLTPLNFDEEPKKEINEKNMRNSSMP